MQSVYYSVFVFQNLIVRSAVPPPEDKIWYWWGDQAIALTYKLFYIIFTAA